MADQPTIFNKDPNTQTPAPNTPASGDAGSDAQNQLATLLAEIKNDRGEPKYKTVQDALTALRHSQDYIPALKQTKEELEAKLQSVSAKADRVDALEAFVQQLTQTENKPATNQSSSVLTEEQVAEMVQRTLSKSQKAALQAQNLESVVASLRQAHGDKAESVFYEKATELGMSRDDFNALAASNPKAVLKLVGGGTTTTEHRPSPNLNTNGFQPKPESAIGRNKATSTLLGATTQDLHQEAILSKALAAEMAEMGKSVHDLSDPKVYFKLFQ